MNTITPDTFNTLIGVAGTLCGTILGWALAKIDFGRLHISIDDFKPYATYFGYNDRPSAYELTFTIKIFNASSRNQVIRDCYVVCFDGKRNQTYKDVPKDKDSAIQIGKALSEKYIGVQNISPQHGLDIHAGCQVQDIEQFMRSKKVYLFYKIGNKKKRKKLVAKRDFSQISRGGKNGGQTENAQPE